MTEQEQDQDSNQETERAGDRLTGWVQIGLVLGVLVGALVINRLLVMSADEPDTDASVQNRPLIEVIQPEPISAQVEVGSTGVVQVRTRVAITPQVSGRVVEVAPELAAGGSFSAGQLLFRIDPTDSELAIERARADVRTAQSSFELEQAEADIALREWHLVNGDEPIPPLVAREPQIAQARAAVESARSRLSDAEVALERTRFSMPFDGRVLVSEIELGQTVNPNASYGSVYPLSAVEVQVAISPSEAESLAPLNGRRAEIALTASAPDRSIQAEVVRVAAELDQRTREVDVILAAEQTERLLPGTFVNATLLGDSVSNVFRLPVEALAGDGRVWVVDDDQLQPVRPSILSREQSTVLTQAFDAADGVAITLPSSIEAGLEVEVQRTEDRASDD